MTIYSASAPAKAILLGEHAVIYGKPAIAIAIDKRVVTTVQNSYEMTLNGKHIDMEYHPHIEYFSEKYNEKPIAVTSATQIPPSSGLGSSAAFCASLSLAIRMKREDSKETFDVANDAFCAEFHAQGRASPIDTFTSTFGGGIAINANGIGKKLGDVEKNGNIWHVESVKVPKMTLVVGYTGIKASTSELVNRVKQFKEKNSFANEIIDELGTNTETGIRALTEEDFVTLGKVMSKNHRLLSVLGVSCNELNKLVEASEKYSYGAKLTGAGGGGSMIALTDQPEMVCKAIRLHGGEPFVVETTSVGAKEES